MTAIAQSATQLTVTGQSEDNFDFALSVSRASERQAKNLTTERRMLNRAKLVSGVCADYRVHFAAIYGKTERLPAAIFEKVEAAVDSHIKGCLMQIHALNVTNFRKSFAHKANDMMFVERVVATGENNISLEAQHLACNIAIGQVQRKLKELEAKPTPDLEREKAIRQQLMKLQLTLNFIEGEQKHQKILETPVTQ